AGQGAVVAEWLVQRRWRRRRLTDGTQAIRSYVDLFGHFGQGWRMSELARERLFGERRCAQQLTDMDRQTDGAAVVGECPRHRLADPPVHVRAESKAFMQV